MREGGRRVRLRRDLEMLVRLLALKMKKGGQEPRNASDLWERQRKELSPRASRRNAVLWKPQF